MSTPKSQFLDTIGLSKLWDKMCDTFPSRTGEGATGTWNININGNAATATTATHADTSDNASNSDKLAGKTPDNYVLKSDIPVPIIINYNTIKDAANSEVNTLSEQTWLKYIVNDTYKNYDWIIQRDGIKYNCTVIPDYDNKHIQILYFTRNEIEGTSGPLGNAIMKYSGLRIKLLPYTENTYLIYKISNGGSLETREFVFGEDYNKNAYLIAAAQMSGIDTIDCKWVYTKKADYNNTVNGQNFYIENSVTNVDAIFSVKDKSLTYVDGNGLINKVTFADNGSYNISKNNPDWNAKEGEVGYIENKPFYAEGDIRQIDVNGDYSILIGEFNIGDRIDVSWDLTYYDGEIFRGSTSFVTQEQPTTYYEKDNFYINGGKTFEMYAYGMCDSLYGKVTVVVNGEIKTLEEIYLPNTVLKTTPQSFSELEKKQVLTNLGLLEEEDTELPIINTTYDDLVSLVGSSALTVGQRYRITDYVCTTTQENTQSAGHQFDVVVTATETNKLSEDATAMPHDGDTYFEGCDLSKWKLKYSLDNSGLDADTKFVWGDTENGKGVIYYMKDEHDNECPYDFKNILMNTIGGYVYTFGGNNYDNSVEGQSHGNVIKRWFDYDDYGYKINFICLYLQTNNNYFGLNCHDITMGSWCDDNTFGDNCYNNTFEDDCYDNTFADSCYGNNFGHYCSNNTFGGECYNNTFEDDCYDNTFGFNCYDNTFESSCSNNTFGESCYSNYFVYCCYGNNFGHYCSNNTFESSCSNNTFGDSCSDNTFGASCSNNTFGDYCSDNTFGASCSDNTFENSCYKNNFGESYSNNTFGNICCNNTFEEFCEDNTFGDSCSNNTFRGYSSHNTFGDYCSNISCGDWGVKDSEFPNQTKYIRFRHPEGYDGVFKNICVKRGVKGESSTPLIVNIDTFDNDYEITVARNSKGELKIYCEADLIA